MINIWRERYDKMASKPPQLDFRVLTAFNANLDKKLDFNDLSLELNKDAEDLEKIENLDDLKRIVKYCYETESNREVDSNNFNEDIGASEISVGGQAGIMSNFLSNLDGEVIFYTPLLSKKLAEKLNKKIKAPYFDKEFKLINVHDAPNTDRTKENIIIEFSEGKSSRLILSDSLKGFGPYFRKSVAENIDVIDQNIDRALLSGFHNIVGNKTAKIEKARRQLSDISSKKHLELVDCKRETFELILNSLGPEIDSIGLDETEICKIAEILDIEISSDIKVAEAFSISQKLIERYNLERIHLHTYRYHLAVAEKDYSISVKDLRDAMIFGEVCAIQCADKGRLPSLNDFESLNFEELYVRDLDPLEEFSKLFELEDFVEKGYEQVSEYKVAAIPTLIHKNPNRLVGMGDIISSGAYAYEISKET